MTFKHRKKKKTDFPNKTPEKKKTKKSKWNTGKNLIFQIKHRKNPWKNMDWQTIPSTTRPGDLGLQLRQLQVVPSTSGFFGTA